MINPVLKSVTVRHDESPSPGTEAYHRETIIDLAETVHMLRISGATSLIGRVDDWQLACELGHDGIADNTELTAARQELGDEACSAIYRAERVRLVVG